MTDIDFQTATAANLEGKTDRQVLGIAARSERLLVTHDRKTMPYEFGQFITSQTSFGVLIVPQSLSIGEAIESLLLIWEASTTEEWLNQVVLLPF